MIHLSIALCLFILGKSRASQEELCPTSFCNSTVSDGKVETFCKQNKTWTMNGRCCVSSDAVIGLDLRSCGINKLNITGSKFTNITVLDLQDNDIEKITKDDLVGFLELNFLYLPENIPCPGDSHAWGNTSYNDNMTSCSYQENPCLYLNISCTDDGECLHTGPGSAKCVCVPGHFGYKCMNEGKFPEVIFFASLTVGTMILCTALWFTLGRDSYKKS